MHLRDFKPDALLLLTAAIWGFAFVAQRAGMGPMGPFTFNGVRFAVGSVSLLPILIISEMREAKCMSTGQGSDKRRLFGMGLAGLLLYLGASFQQTGLVYTTAGKAGFITGLYVVLVPFLGILFGKRTGLGTWSGAFLAFAGLYLLSVTEGFIMFFGDLLVLIGSFFWAGHVMVIGWLAPIIKPVRLAFFQYVVCSSLSFVSAALSETFTLEGVYQALLPILYCGLLSVGVAYTLQVVAQKDARPAHAAILLSLEAVFAAIGGWMVLGETLLLRGIVGCFLMVSGMFLSQLERL
ncbi:MAG: DMT family transporter [Candidatus Bathyarchaeia archaeon]